MAKLLRLFCTASLLASAACSADPPPGATVASDSGTASDGGTGSDGMVVLTDGGHYVSLAWTPSPTPGVTYDIYRGAMHGGPYTQIQGGAPSASATDTTVMSGATYYYVVRSKNANGESSDSNEVQAGIP